MTRRLTPVMAMTIALVSSANMSPAAELVQHEQHRPKAPAPYVGRRKSKGRAKLPWERKHKKSKR